MAELKARSDALDNLKSTLAQSFPQKTFEKLHYEIILPSYSPKRWRKLPSRQELAANNAAFTKEVHHLFRLLSAYDQDENISPFILELAISSPTDSLQQDPRQKFNEGTGPDRNNNAYVKFDTSVPEPLPIVSKVIGLQDGIQARGLHPSALGVILRALPCLQKMYWQLIGPEVRLLELRREIRSSLADALAPSNLPSLQELEIYREDADCLNHSFEADSLVSGSGIDELSVAFGKLSQLPSLRVLNLQGIHILSPELFSSCDSTQEPRWPSLETLFLSISSMIPYGGWYYTGDPDSVDISDERDYDSDVEEEDIDSSNSDTADYPAVWEWVKLNGARPQHDWRVQPDPETFNPLLLEMAKEVRHMPSLRRLNLKVGESSAALTSEVECLAPGEKDSLYVFVDARSRAFDELYRGQRRWEIMLTTRREIEGDVDTIWEVPDEMKQALKESAKSDDESVIIINGSTVQEAF